MFRRVITTVMYGDGSSRSTAQDFLFDKSLDAWFEETGPFDYYGPGVAPVGERGFGHGNGRGNTPVDNVLRMNEFLRVGHSIASVDRKFTAVLESDCNLVVYHLRGGGKKVKSLWRWGGGACSYVLHALAVRPLTTRLREDGALFPQDRSPMVWETSSFSSEGRCFVAIQDNGMLVVMAGNDPSAPGNVLWSNNQAHVGWFRQNSFHAAVLPSGNLVVSQGDSPMHSAARRCVWGAFGCPGDGGVMEWKLVWMSFRTKAGDIWCKVKGCDGDGAGEYSYYSDSGDNPGGNGTRDSSSWKRQSGGGGGAGVDGGAFDPWAAGRGGGREDDGGGGGGGGGGGISHLLTQPGAAIKKAAGRGVAWLTEALAKIKSAAEDSAYAASRPRHW
ncbi:expressed unknown protein [Ectocarpus siliculosus]|uniref:Bulb-type lectin domain-containing protein n=1 Tax=Ectocarpus siliculosus TaxID=2880 RepID=D7FV20_ECTSI|nr:expressed unknown protein [Ectocarpus siliculosus]|eukprot:CBJ31826.1 expressed unknown protein [Ectocarpus siliculosus]